MSRYINPFTDFGFKCIFGREDSKPFLIDFLNELLKDEPGFETIVDIKYLDKENTSQHKEDRTVVYDILCQTVDDSKKFIVEMQNSSQAYFTDRSIYYISKAYIEQGKKGKWNYMLMPVYFVAFMNFTLPALAPNIRTDLCDLRSQYTRTDNRQTTFDLYTITTFQEING